MSDKDTASGGHAWMWVAVLLAGCSSHAGIDLRPGAAAPELQDLARQARSGDKRAQLDLGLRYEEGRDGLPRDQARACRLYAAAARDDDGRMWVYSPPVGETPGGALALAGVPSLGLNEARARAAARCAG